MSNNIARTIAALRQHATATALSCQKLQAADILALCDAAERGGLCAPAAPAPASRFGDVTVVDGVAGDGGASVGGTAGPPWSGDGGTWPYTPTPAAPAAETVCDWHQDGEDSETWQTGCGHYFTIIDGTPTDNEFRHCCFCGHLLAQHLHENDYDDE